MKSGEDAVYFLLIDAANVIRVSGNHLDWTHIETWCAELGADGALAGARSLAED